MYKKPIALFGGTFDPIHNGHIKIAQMLQKKLSLEEVRFIPCKIPVLKEEAHADANDRLAMLEIAIGENPSFKIDTLELDRTTPSYTVETLRTVRSMLPNTPLCFILGMDAFLDLQRWYQWQELLNLAHLVIINRNSHLIVEDSVLAELMAKHSTANTEQLKSKLAGHIFQMHIPPIPLSSSSIRQQINSGQDVNEFLPPGVWEYIKTRDLYKNSTPDVV